MCLYENVCAFPFFSSFVSFSMCVFSFLFISQVRIDSECENVLVWSIGGGRVSSLVLECLLEFDTSTPPTHTDFVEDPFCNGITTYADIAWTVEGKTLTHTAIDIDNLRINPPPKSNIRPFITYTLSSLNYRVWNADGKARTCSHLMGQ
eukprot:m.229941 g.229941  ORF g.229941 m.229941 type:complete len:149 (-) comp13888_c2_seq4:2026-2472(-)